MEFKLNTANLTEHFYNQAAQPFKARLHKQGSIQHSQLGNINLNSHVMPGIRAIELGWQIPGKGILLSDQQQGNQAINISFQLQGSMVTRFAGIHHPLNMKTGVHNLVYLSEQGDTHAMEANQHISVFQITIDKHYFLQCIETNNRWSDEIINKTDKNMPFAVAEQSFAISPRMHHLIQSIQRDTQPGPMKKLLFQSRMLELLALQVEQYSNQNKTEAQCISADDLQKLHALKTYLDNHFLADLRLEQLSRISCLNEFKLKKGFKTCFGETVFGYIRKLRMLYAGNLLHNTSYTIDEIAASLGYEHAHHFSKAFKGHTGYLPTVYRREVSL